MKYWIERRELEPMDLVLMELPEEHWETSVDEITSRSEDGSLSPRTVARTYVDHLREMRKKGHGLFVYGPEGTGKSAIAAHLLKALRRHGQSGLWIESDRIRDVAAEGAVDTKGRDLWRRLKRDDAVVIDDLGPEYAEWRDPWGQRKFGYALRERYQNDRVTLLTSQMSRKQFEEAYPASILSIVSDAVTFVRVKAAGRPADPIAARTSGDSGT